MKKAVVFDFGRVITAQKPRSLFCRYEEILGIAPGRLNSIMFDSPAWKDALVGRMTVQEFWHSIGPELGLNKADEIDRFRRRYHQDEAINQGVLDLIHSLYGRYRLAVLSNSPPGLSQWLADWEILDLFDVVFCSGDEGMVKPDPTVFSVTLARLDVMPQESVFIDDTKEHVEAALKLGLHGIVFTTAESLQAELSDLLSEK